MAKLPQSTIKYLIEAQLEAEGVVEKPDVIGAVFGQTEGLLGTELELRELQKTGRIGRIEVEVSSENGKSKGTIIIPSSLNSSETALIAAALETIERIGPCVATVKSVRLEDVRISKRKYVMDRAKDILKQLVDASPGSETMTAQVKEDVMTSEVTEYNGMSCGPDVPTDDSIIFVEGRADVINLLRNGIKNAVAIGGTGVATEAISDLTRFKTITAFLDGDRGGELILKKLLQIVKIDFVAFAPEGKEVEELAKKEIYKSLEDRVPVKDLHLGAPEKKYAQSQERQHAAREIKPRFQEKRIRISRTENQMFMEVLDSLVGTRAACVYDDKLELLGRIPSKELGNSMRAVKPYAIIFDGRIEQFLVDIAEEVGVKYLVGMERDRLRRTNVIVLTRRNLEGR
ncbi:MAG: DNA primase DnaG [Candidatus Aenigmatarchaeota archaeon]